MTAGVVQIRNGKVFTEGGKVLTAGIDGTGTGTGCCTCLVCEKDCTIVSPSGGCTEACLGWTLDLGAGGWTDEECDNCGNVAGEFDLVEAAQSLPFICRWTYTEDPWCACASITPDYQLNMVLTIKDLGSQVWSYTAAVKVGAHFPSGTPSSEALYSSNSTTDPDCLSLLGEAPNTGTGSAVPGRVALFKTSEIHIDEDDPLFPGITCLHQPCSGSMPNTIYAFGRLV